MSRALSGVSLLRRSGRSSLFSALSCVVASPLLRLRPLHTGGLQGRRVRVLYTQPGLTPSHHLSCLQEHVGTPSCL